MASHKPSLIESIAEKLRLIPNLHGGNDDDLPPIIEPGDLTTIRRRRNGTTGSNTKPRAVSGGKENYMIVPTTCFNCEAGCGLLSYVDKETSQVRKFEGNPYHPGQPRP